MNKSLLKILVVSIPTFLFGQFAAGTYSPDIDLGLEISVAVSEHDGELYSQNVTTEVYTSVGAQYFVLNNLALSLSLSKSGFSNIFGYYDNDEISQEYQTDRSSVYLSPGTVLYLGKKSLKFFGSGELIMNIDKLSSVDLTADEEYRKSENTLAGIGLKTGVSYLITPNIAMEPYLYLDIFQEVEEYKIYPAEYSQKSDISIVNMGARFRLSYYFINKK